MSFQAIPQIEKFDFYTGVAFRKANEKAKNARTKIEGNKFEKSRNIELLKLEVFKANLINNLKEILRSFPAVDKLPEFYRELVKCTLEHANLKISLGALNWAAKKVEELYRLYKEKIKKTRDFDKINYYRREYYGRVASVLKQIRKELEYLEYSRKIIKEYPVIKTSLPTVCICGFPNIGKTTLLFKLTGSKPEINSYPFTTKSINVAYLTVSGKTIQLLDVPGTLNRFNKMNNIEKQAYLAIKHLAGLIIYVFDLTEPYPIGEQAELYNNLKRLDKKIIVYLSKTDLANKKIIDEFKKKYESISDVERLKEIVSKETLSMEENDKNEKKI